MIYALNMLDGMDFGNKEALKERMSTMAKNISEFIKLYLLTAPVAMQNSKSKFSWAFGCIYSGSCPSGESFLRKCFCKSGYVKRRERRG